MDYRIVDKPSFGVIGKALRVSTVEGAHLQAIPAFWKQSEEDGTCRRLRERAAGEVTRGTALGICTDFQRDLQEFTYLIAAETGAGSAPEGFVTLEIPAAHWAVFQSVGRLPEAIQKVWGQIFSEFFPATGLEHAEGGSELEVYLAGNPDEDHYRCEVWIPILKKSK